MKNSAIVVCVFVFLSVILSLGGCAVMDKDIPGWSQYRSPVKASKLQLASKSIGEGEPVLLIHGFGASSYSWRYIVEPLSQKYRVITIDLKGFGDSPKPRDDAYSVYEQASLVRNFILENDLKNLHIVGHSYGGGVALATSIYLSLSHPNLQRSLVLIDSIAYPQELPGFVKMLATPVLGPLLIYAIPNTIQVKDLLKKVYFNDALIPQSAIDHYADNLSKSNAKYATLTTARQILPTDLQQFSENYTDLTLPTLIIWSRDDEIVPLAIGERLHKSLSNSRLIVFSDVGHAVQEEEPSWVLPYLQQFLEAETRDTMTNRVIFPSN